MTFGSDSSRVSETEADAGENARPDRLDAVRGQRPSDADAVVSIWASQRPGPCVTLGAVEKAVVAGEVSGCAWHATRGEIGARADADDGRAGHAPNHGVSFVGRPQADG